MPSPLLPHDVLSDQQITALLKAVARASQAVLTLYSANEVSFEKKEDGSPVTHADRTAHEILVTALETICPGMKVISEEDSKQTQVEPQESFWLVDPLDGTREFIDGNGQFTVNTGLIRQGHPVFGIVAAPVLERVWVGNVIKRRAFVIESDGRSQTIHTRICPPEGLTVVGSRNHHSPCENKYLEDKKVAAKTSIGSSLKFCLVAEGKADLYLRGGKTMEWDTAAGHAVLKAAGGRVSDWTDSPLTYGKDNFANASGFIAHAH